ncbi:MAG: hypothetical protein HRF50_00445 [Phycisphaerae bacterium]
MSRVGILCASSLAALTFLVGCPTAPAENVITLGIKAATGQLTTSTPREWQALADRISQASETVDVSLSDAEAGAIVDFVQANDLNTVQEIRDLIQQAREDPSSVDVVIPDSVYTLFGEGSNLDAILGGG